MKKENKRIRLVFKILGIIFVVSGFSCLIFGFVDFFKAFNDVTSTGPQYFYMNFIGIILLGFGFFFIAIGFRKEFIKYRTEEISSVINGIKNNSNDSFVDFSNKRVIVCSQCKTENSNDSKFCKSCGSPLVKTCPYCNHVLNNDSIYCENCGMKVDSSKKN